ATAPVPSGLPIAGAVAASSELPAQPDLAPISSPAPEPSPAPAASQGTIGAGAEHVASNIDGARRADKKTQQEHPDRALTRTSAVPSAGPPARMDFSG